MAVDQKAPGPALQAAAKRVRQRYSHGEHRPLGSFVVLTGCYVAAVGVGFLVARSRGVRVPARPAVGDLALVAIATLRTSRLIAKDSVTSPLRAPFTRFQEAGGAGEVNEQVVGRGARKAMGELLSCPFCIGQWVSTGLVGGLVLAPRATRWLAATMCVSAAADTLQFGRALLEHAAE
ncbi:MAG TPA: DUF1360 domain-containing protein [Sporichthyaceae bacterium]|jgi:hypothetical protein|nr:DUF1360 domain-containing protein [Sporichthyaceae bacterium]